MSADPYLKVLASSVRRRVEWRSHIIIFLLQNSRVAAAAFEIGELARYSAWCKRMSKRQSQPTRRFVTRESLWTALVLPSVGKAQKIMVAEFGVASGIGARWWLDHISSPSLVYRGFDTFWGMPVDFKGVPKGGLSMGGVPPQLDDKRIVWHVGDVSETVSDVDWATAFDVRIFLFDLDLYLPSLKAWEVTAPHFRKGDIIYFDEAYSEDEFRLIREKIEGNPKFSLLGFTPYSLLCKVVS